MKAITPQPLAGSVRQRGPRYQVRYRVGGTETSRSFATLAEAREFQLELTARGALQADGFGLGRRLLLTQAIRAWAAEQPHRPTTRDTVRSYVNNMVLAHLGDPFLADITRQELLAWVHAMPAAPSTKDKALTIVQSALSYARDRGWIDRDPSGGVRVPGANKTRRRHLPTVDQVELLLGDASARSPRLGGAIAVMAYGGCSVSEAAGLRVADVDIEGGRLFVSGAATLHEDRTYRRGPMKTGTRDRAVPVMPRRAFDRLEPLLAGRQADELLLRGPRDGILRPDNFRTREFGPLVARLAQAGHLPPLTPHVLRHFACSVWNAAGATDYDIADWAGHASVQLVRNTYTHSLPRTGSALEEETLAELRAARQRPRPYRAAP